MWHGSSIILINRYGLSIAEGTPQAPQRSENDTRRGHHWIWYRHAPPPRRCSPGRLQTHEHITEKRRWGMRLAHPPHSHGRFDAGRAVPLPPWEKIVSGDSSSGAGAIKTDEPQGAKCSKTRRRAPAPTSLVGMGGGGSGPAGLLAHVCAGYHPHHVQRTRPPGGWPAAGDKPRQGFILKSCTSRSRRSVTRLQLPGLQQSRGARGCSPPASRSELQRVEALHGLQLVVVAEEKLGVLALQRVQGR